MIILLQPQTQAPKAKSILLTINLTFINGPLNKSMINSKITNFANINV